MQDVIIDGYNLLRTDPELIRLERNGLESAREALITRLVNASGLRSARSITVVFDGHKNGYPYQTTERRANGRILVIYSKLGESADEVIKRMVAERAGSSGKIRVITRDWEIKNATSESGATSGVMKRRPSFEKAREKMSEDKEEGGWNQTTQKKGPAKRTKKSDRKRGPDNDLYW
ncbi:MAG: NYN domain-containing protein [Chloroflexi bacterium]|nr:NYN domain-containing protein [Chloroflexota bacterium]